jgi:hypothetical protein
MRDKLIELIDNNKVCPYDFPCTICGYNEYSSCLAPRLADILISNGVTFATDGDLLDRETVIDGVLKQMGASTSLKCMEEFLWNLQGVTFADINVGD